VGGALSALTCTTTTCLTSGLTATLVWIFLISFVVLVFVVVCFVRITQKAGYSGWWAVLLFLPYIVGFLDARSPSIALQVALLFSLPAPLVYLGWLAFAAWPATAGPRHPPSREAYFAPDPYLRPAYPSARPAGAPGATGDVPLPPLPQPRTTSGTPPQPSAPGAGTSGTVSEAPGATTPVTVAPPATALPPPPPALPPDGWYPSARAPGYERYWANGQWTDQFRPAPRPGL
jgi:uncharacterized membrane protein YhaH (DUF805 family)